MTTPTADERAEEIWRGSMMDIQEHLELVGMNIQDRLERVPTWPGTAVIAAAIRAAEQAAMERACGAVCELCKSGNSPKWYDDARAVANHMGQGKGWLHDTGEDWLYMCHASSIRAQAQGGGKE